MFTRRAVTSSRIECGKEKTHHRHTLHSQSNAKRNKFKSPNRCFMCVQQNLIRFEIFSGWFVEPHLRAVSMKIERLRWRCCWGSKCFPFVSHSLLLLRTHHESHSMFIIPVDSAVAMVVERARFYFFLLETPHHPHECETFMAANFW